jgi:thiamine-phosphate pyrophosphorylase
MGLTPPRPLNLIRVMPAKEARRSLRTHPPIPRLFCLVDATTRVDVLPALVAAGVDGFQVRDKSLSTVELTGLARTVVDAVRPLGACVVVNDRLDIALAVGAEGVHLGVDDLPVADARRIAPELVIGATCRSREAVEAAHANGADYCGFGPIFANTGKPGLPDPLGPEAMAAATGLLPLIAIGGVNDSNAAAARASGAHGVAVIGGIWAQPDAVIAAAAIAEALCE